MFDEIILVNPPGEEPVELRELKLQAGETGDKYDERLYSMMVGAREDAEKFTRRSLISQTLDVIYSQLDGIQYVELPRGKVQNVLEVTTYEYLGNDAVVVNPDTYTLMGSTLIFNDWLPNYRLHRGIRVRIISGYGLPSAVPQAIKEGILELATHRFDNRAGESNTRYVAQLKSGALPDGVRSKWQRFQLTIV